MDCSWTRARALPQLPLQPLLAGDRARQWSWSSDLQPVLGFGEWFLDGVPLWLWPAEGGGGGGGGVGRLGTRVVRRRRRRAALEVDELGGDRHAGGAAERGEEPSRGELLQLHPT
jgi:hypothetical protein